MRWLASPAPESVAVMRSRASRIVIDDTFVAARRRDKGIPSQHPAPSRRLSRPPPTTEAALLDRQREVGGRIRRPRNSCPRHARVRAVQGHRGRRRGGRAAVPRRRRARQPSGDVVRSQSATGRAPSSRRSSRADHRGHTPGLSTHRSGRHRDPARQLARCHHGSVIVPDAMMTAFAARLTIPVPLPVAPWNLPVPPTIVCVI